MSVYKNKNGIIVAELLQGYSSAEEYRMMLESIIDLVQDQEINCVNKQTTYHAMKLIKNMLPTDCQWELILNNSNVDSNGEVYIKEHLIENSSPFNYQMKQRKNASNGTVSPTSSETVIESDGQSQSIENQVETH